MVNAPPLFILKKFQTQIENIESELRLKHSSIEPNVQNLMSEMQHHTSH